MAKRLVLMHGAPGSGKSTFIKKLSLEYLTISADTIRLLFSEPEVMVVDNHSCMQFSRKYDKEAWELIFKALEERMKNGSDTVIDACNFTQDFIERYKSLADPHGFHMIALDFSSLPLNVLLKRNKRRSLMLASITLLSILSVTDIREWSQFRKESIRSMQLLQMLKNNFGRFGESLKHKLIDKKE